MSPWLAFRADLARYRRDDWLVGAWWLSERTIWAIATFRFGQLLLTVRPAWLRRIVFIPYSLLLPFVHAVTGIEIWPHTQIGPGLRIYHGQGLVINPSAVIGANVMLRQGVTIGVRRPDSTAAPRIGDDVQLGAYAQVFGDITVGDGARIGSLSVVLQDVPAGATAVGIPATVT